MVLTLFSDLYEMLFWGGSFATLQQFGVNLFYFICLGMLQNFFSVAGLATKMLQMLQDVAKLATRFSPLFIRLSLRLLQCCRIF